MKTYKMTWIDEVGNSHPQGDIKTKNPKSALADLWSKYATLCNSAFGKLNHDNIQSNIYEGKHPSRESYYMDCEGVYGTQVLCIMEVEK